MSQHVTHSSNETGQEQQLSTFHEAASQLQSGAQTAPSMDDTARGPPEQEEGSSHVASSGMPRGYVADAPAASTDTAGVFVELIRGVGRGCSDIQHLLLVGSALCHVATCQVYVDGTWWAFLREDALEVGGSGADWRFGLDAFRRCRVVAGGW